ncbi:hypothetical protein PCL_09509, partial [Purpureocillium lilacinum]
QRLLVTCVQRRPKTHDTMAARSTPPGAAKAGKRRRDSSDENTPAKASKRFEESKTIRSGKTRAWTHYESIPSQWRRYCLLVGGTLLINLWGDLRVPMDGYKYDAVRREHTLPVAGRSWGELMTILRFHNQVVIHPRAQGDLPIIKFVDRFDFHDWYRAILQPPSVESSSARPGICENLCCWMGFWEFRLWFSEVWTRGGSH